MATAADAIDRAIADSERLRKILKKTKTPQVRSFDERALAKATASTWFSNYRNSILNFASSNSINAVDDYYRTILESSDRDGARSKYLTTLSILKLALIKMRTEALAFNPVTTATTDQPPDFSPLISDPEMQKVLLSRWNECLLCLLINASLAATVMMGGLLEALLLARINREADKSAIFTAKTAPKNSKTQSPKPLGEWMLNDFIQVLSELKWITTSATAVGAVLRDYRNYIHPQKQLSHNLHLTPADASLFWEVTKNIARQVISSVD